MATEVKFCGLTRAEDVDSAVELGASYVGFVFAPSARRTTAARVREMARHLPSDVLRVGVFADCTPEAVLDAVTTAELQVVQLHDPALLGLTQELRVHGIAVWCVAHVVDGRVAAHAITTGRGVDAVLVDTRVGKRLGGTGVPFDWTAARDDVSSLRSVCRVALAGGLRPDNVAEAIQTLSPDIVDVSSGVEAQPGIKDRGRMRAFVQAVREAALA